MGLEGVPLRCTSSHPSEGQSAATFRCWLQPDDSAERFASVGGVGGVAFPRSGPAAVDSPGCAPLGLRGRQVEQEGAGGGLHTPSGVSPRWPI